MSENNTVREFFSLVKDVMEEMIEEERQEKADRKAANSAVDKRIDGGEASHDLILSMVRVNDDWGSEKAIWKRVDIDSVVPVDPTAGCGIAGNYAVDAGLCAARHITKFWGLAQEASPGG